MDKDELLLPDRQCFHCGTAGHTSKSCPIRTSHPQSMAGKEALRRYRHHRKLHSSSLVSIQKRKRVHLERVIEWMSMKKANNSNANASSYYHNVDLEDNNNTTITNHHQLMLQVRDPIAILKAEELAVEVEASCTADASNNNNNNNNTNKYYKQRQHDEHKSNYNNLHNAYRNEFNRIISNIRTKLAKQLHVSSDMNILSKSVCTSYWQAELTRAVELGRPANFSSMAINDDDDDDTGGNYCNDDNDDDDDGIDNDANELDAKATIIEGEEEGEEGRCIKVYTVGKLNARCRQLHHLMFNDDDDDVYSTKVRSLLLPVVVPLSTSATGNNNNNGCTAVNIISLGGGPGYDHVALCLLAKFLHDIQPTTTNTTTRLKQTCIQTKVFDLYDNDWRPIMTSLNECLHESMIQEDDNDNGNDGESLNHNPMTMHHADLRLGIDDPSNVELEKALQTVDIICVQFCLHENASFIVEDLEVVSVEEEEDGNDTQQQQQQCLRGVTRDIFNRAPIGTIMIVTDSVNTLFPILKHTAKEHGWTYMGDEEMRRSGKKLIFLGPKSFVMLERVCEKFVE